jgi:hypothetical protein
MFYRGGSQEKKPLPSLELSCFQPDVLEEGRF